MHTIAIAATALALSLATASAVAQVQTAPLPEPPETTAVTRDRARQTGIATFELPGRQQVIVRSFEPDTALPDSYRISFEALDTDGDGFIDRGEAAAHSTLAGEFRGVDVDGDGKLSRAELVGWTGER
ncbi:EF-hand domain-containing protein [Luteimonas salinilitoris]|uniref:EF-hand domain-containing protein n=1 Tax=Luteimonas salinilitoris TaxID=3237697 RepID=A0ABV4HS75_9GAMM